MSERMTMKHIQSLLEDDYDPTKRYLEILARSYTGGPLELIIRMHSPVELSREFMIYDYDPPQSDLDLLYGGYAPKEVELEQIVAGPGPYSGKRELMILFEASEKSRLSIELLGHISREFSEEGR